MKPEDRLFRSLHGGESLRLSLIRDMPVFRWQQVACLEEATYFRSQDVIGGFVVVVIVGNLKFIARQRSRDLERFVAIPGESLMQGADSSHQREGNRALATLVADFRDDPSSKFARI